MSQQYTSLVVLIKASLRLKKSLIFILSQYSRDFPMGHGNDLIGPDNLGFFSKR